MTRKPRTRANLESKIIELTIKLTRRKTTKISRRINLQKRIEFFKNLLHELPEENSIGVGAETDQSVTSLSTDSAGE